MRKSGPDSRTLVTWALFAQIVFGIRVAADLGMD